MPLAKTATATKWPQPGRKWDGADAAEVVCHYHRGDDPLVSKAECRRCRAEVYWVYVSVSRDGHGWSANRICWNGHKAARWLTRPDYDAIRAALGAAAQEVLPL